MRVTPIIVGVSLLAMASYLPILMCLKHRYREQAHSYRALVLVSEYENAARHCGSWQASSHRVLD
ncbi:hypothetical protein J3D48_005255 [Pseudomonas fluorescens]|jgi:hypothetical protein|nr:hypothetical protein [Pseudomonas fluorescens]